MRPLIDGKTKRMTRARFREIEELIHEIEDQGYAVKFGKNGHWKVYTPQGIVILPGTSSDFRGIKNAKSQLRRYGVRV